MLKFLFIITILTGAVNLTDVSYYEILGVTKQASTHEIRQAYKKLAVKFHPDKNSNTADQEMFLKITEAYETLKDPEKKQKYDLYGSYPSYSRKYDYKSQAEYDNLYYNGLYHNDPFVDTLSGANFYNYLSDGFYFINFYSPFCPPCQSVADHWKKLAEKYKGIVKVGAVNCKHHNSFCYNSMRIGSYPSLLFYPNGKNGNYIYYRGERTLDALDNFVMTYVRSAVHVPIVAKLRSNNSPMVYVLGENRIERDALTRIAYHLNGLVTVVVVEDDSVRAQLSNDDYITAVYKYKGTSKLIQTSEEKEVLREIVDALPRVNVIKAEDIQIIRNKLRSGSKVPWVLYFSTKNEDRLKLYQMRMSLSNMEFGEINCDKWNELCASLHVDVPPAWGILKRGGIYQRAPSGADPRDFILTAAKALRLHTLSASDFAKILNGEVGLWVLLVVPHQVSWDHLADPFTRTSLHFNNDGKISFGIMACTSSTDKYCRRVARSHPSVIVQDGTKRHTYNGRVTEQDLLQYIALIRETTDMELNEQQVLEILDPSNREYTWLVAYFQANCGLLCDQLVNEWMIVAKKLRALDFVRVGMLKCADDAGGFCNNVRSPTARLYPIASGRHYSVSLQHLAQAPYMLEWAMEFIDDSVVKLNSHSFTKTVIAEELNPTGGKKPWLIYFHSPRCYRCYEMYSDFAISGILLNNAVNLGKVNCIAERGLCQHEQITSYPSLKLYLSRNRHQRFSSVITIPVTDYDKLLQQIKPHLMKYDQNILGGIDNIDAKGFGIRHDEF